MLYVTTRDNKDAYTVHNTMLSDIANDGGLFVPFQIPILSTEELNNLSNRSFGENVSDILNRFFSARINGWTVDTAIGRNCLKTTQLSQKIISAETWHNPGCSYSYVVEHLYRLLSDSDAVSKVPTNWVKVAVKIAMIFGAYADMLSENVLTADEKFDIAVDATDFIDPLAALYAKNMGLPIHMILCASADSDGIWDLIHRGQISTATVSDALSLGIERLIYSVYGSTEAGRYVDALKERKSYSVDAEIERSLLEHFFCAVVGSSRIGTVVNSVERTDKYTLCTEAALAYGAIQDYRAKTGENRVTLLFSNQDPN